MNETKRENDLAPQRTVAGTMVRNTILLRILRKEFDAIPPHMEPTSLAYDRLESRVIATTTISCPHGCCCTRCRRLHAISTRPIL